MGIAYTIDTPLKVSQYGIDSVISLVDDILLEKLRKMYCSKFNLPYFEITENDEDFRAKRITSYLNLICKQAENKFEELKTATIEKGKELKEYFNMLPDNSAIKEDFRNLSKKYFNLEDISSWIKENLSMGSIDVNIMTKVDKDNYKQNEKLPVEFNDAHAALRGFANSNLTSSVILSAGMNPRLYGYLENFEDFYPNEKGFIKKKIILKVSDFRSAMIQGRYLAKKGLWVSEYRIESGLNCGGHAFATDGFLLGPILVEFRDKRQDLINSNFEIIIKALAAKNKPVPENVLILKITAQGGVGTSEEHQFLIDHYKIDSVGWGSPFLLVPEATTIDDNTLSQLIDAKEDDLYLSNISPLGVPFNSLRGNTKDAEKQQRLDKGKPGSTCPKKYLALNGEYSGRNICTASRQYQRKKLKGLGEENSTENNQTNIDNITEKSCICVGLGTPALLVNNLDHKAEGRGVSVCPGPNIAYFSKIMTLSEITDHIYGRSNMISRTDRPNMFVNELKIYIEYLRNKIEEAKTALPGMNEKYLTNFANNLKEGIQYYYNLFNEPKEFFKETREKILGDLESGRNQLQNLNNEISGLSKVSATSL